VSDARSYSHWASGEGKNYSIIKERKDRILEEPG